jgi:uncharacterized protein YndB with AHSA1/START domain
MIVVAGGEMQHVEVSHHFDAPPARVWERYTDHRGWTDWAGVGRVTLDATGEPPPNGVGCVRKITTGGFSVWEEVVAFEPERRMTYRLVRGALPIRDHLGEVLFAPEGDGTRVVWRCRFDSTVLGIGALLRLGIQHVFGRVLDRLARRGDL